MKLSEPQRTVDVGIIVVPETAPAILYSLSELFSFVANAWEMMTGQKAGPVRMRPWFVAENLEPLECAAGGLVRPQARFDDECRYDVVIATDLLLDPGVDPRGRWKTAVRWIREQHAQGALLASVCTGSLLLAETGLLDGMEATTHWGSIDLFRRCYPSVILQPEKVLSISGDAHRVITAGGASSWAELALYLVALYCGQEEAARTAKVFLLGDRSEGQLPFAAMARPRGHEDACIDQCQCWIAEHYAQRNPVKQMVEVSGLSERTFKRRFKRATGYSPIEYVQTLRVEEARHLLETTPLATDDIATEVGYEDPATFRRLFKRLTGVTPARYRQRFQLRTPGP